MRYYLLAVWNKKRVQSETSYPKYGIIKRINEHLHGSDMQKILCLETKTGIKRKAAQTQDSTHHIAGESVSNTTEGTAAKLPKLNSLKRTIQRERRKANLAFLFSRT